MVVLWRFHSRAESETAQAEKIAARIAGGLFFSVALFVAATSFLALLGYYEPRPSVVGIALLISGSLWNALAGKPETEIGTQLSSAALRADAAESSLCGYLSWIALAGLVANALFRIGWADPVAALILLPFIFKEGWRAVHAFRPGCNCCSVSLPKPVRQQIREAHERLPARRSVGQPSIETGVEDEIFSRRVAHGPKTSYGVAAEEGLCEVPDFTRKRELPDDRM